MQDKKKERKTIMEMTLCHNCASNFRNSGYVVVQKGFQEDKEECDFCHVRQGLTYCVFSKN